MILIGENNDGNLGIYEFEASRDKVSMTEIGSIKPRNSQWCEIVLGCDYDTSKSAQLIVLLTMILSVPITIIDDIPKWTHK
ncbi:hypothetical protein LCGC14_2252890 [marine sediment metagenome]|uniref:Uncharacterized protein n=1 Tax=marine sediment metagenome TaxID=412755 RepID=A0A0F9FWY7_9ZZZZ